jgi:hypothetical protein
MQSGGMATGNRYCTVLVPRDGRAGMVPAGVDKRDGGPESHVLGQLTRFLLLERTQGMPSAPCLSISVNTKYFSKQIASRDTSVRRIIFFY